MNDSTDYGLCPCESGLQYADCCGVPGRTAVNAGIQAKITLQGIESNGELTQELHSAIETIGTNPDLFFTRFNIFEDRAYFVKMSQRWYQESVFLDPARIMGKYVVESDNQWLADTADKIVWQPTSFIFHTAFCGSTLMAQALGTVFNCLPLREPEVLSNVLFYIRSHNVDDKDKQVWFGRVMQLLSRRYDSQQGVVVKTNDNSNPLMLKMLSWRQDIPVLFMYTPLSEFLAGCLKAPNRREWIRGRFRAIRAIVPQVLTLPENFSLKDDAYGEMAAVYWSYNVALYLQAWQSSAEFLRSLDFNNMLAHPLESVEACGRLFALQALPDVNHAEEMDKLFGVYSKNSNIKYSPQQRSDDIKNLLKEYQTELDAAERMAQEILGDNYPRNGLPGSLLD